MKAVLIACCGAHETYARALRRAGADVRHVVARRRRLDDPTFAGRLSTLRPDLLVTAGCPAILGPELLTAARRAAVNVHPSLLPRYRGRHPVFWAVRGAARETGVTVHHLTAVVDGGPVLAQRALALPPDATTGWAASRLDALGAELLGDLVAGWVRGEAISPGVPQSAAVERCRPVRAADGRLDPRGDAEDVARAARAAMGVVEPYLTVRGMRCVILDVEVSDAARAVAPPGTVLSSAGGGCEIACARGVLRFARAWFVGRVMPMRDALSLAGVREGERLDPVEDPHGIAPREREAATLRAR